METPKTLSEIQQMITDRVQESLHLDYKGSAALGNSEKISKDVSAFTHSDGGVIIYGVEEIDHLPIRIDAIKNKDFSRERLGQIISANIRPKIVGLRIFPIEVSDSESIYVVEIPRSSGSVHMASTKQYHKRYEFESRPMEHYEIDDVRSRRSVIQPLFIIDAEARKHWIYLTISNIGNVPAFNVSFSFPPDLPWHRVGAMPRLIENGIACFPPSKTYRFRWNDFATLMRSPDEQVRKFDAAVTYQHPQHNEYITETFHIDVESYLDTISIKTDVEELTKVVEDSSRQMMSEIKKLNQNIEHFKEISNGTGLNLSITTLRNLQRVYTGSDEFEKIPAALVSSRVFQEVLNIDHRLAYQLEDYYWPGSAQQNLEDIDGMTPDLIEKLKRFFIIEKIE